MCVCAFVCVFARARERVCVCVCVQLGGLDRDSVRYSGRPIPAPRDFFEN